MDLKFLSLFKNLELRITGQEDGVINFCNCRNEGIGIRDRKISF